MVSLRSNKKKNPKTNSVEGESVRSRQRLSKRKEESPFSSWSMVCTWSIIAAVHIVLPSSVTHRPSPEKHLIWLFSLSLLQRCSLNFIKSYCSTTGRKGQPSHAKLRISNNQGIRDFRSEKHVSAKGFGNVWGLVITVMSHKRTHTASLQRGENFC